MEEIYHSAAPAALSPPTDPAGRGPTTACGVSRALEQVAGRALGLLGGAACAVFAIQPADGRLRLLGGVGTGGRQDTVESAAVEGGVASRAVASHAPAATGESAMPAALAAPILVGGEAFGALVLYRDRPGGFGDGEARLLALLAEHAGVVVENTRRQDRERALGRQVEAARAVSGEIVGTADASSLLQAIQRCAVDLVGGTAGVLYLWDEEAGVLMPRAWCGYEDWIRGACAAPGQGAAGMAAQRRESLVVNGDPRRDGTGLQVQDGAGATATAAAPILMRDRLLGVVTVDHQEAGRAFSEQDREVLAHFAAQAALAIENALLSARQREAAARAEHQRARAEALAAVGKAMAASMDLDRLFRLLVERAAAATQAAGAAILERDPATGDLRVRRAHGLSQGFAERLAVPPGAGIEGIVLATRQPLWTVHVLADPRFTIPDPLRAAFAEEGIHGILAAPVREGEDFSGVLCLYWRDLHLFDDEEIGFTARIAEHAALALENARLHQQEQARRRQVEGVRAVAAEILRELDLPTVLDLIQRRAMEMVGAASGAIWLWEEAEGVLVPRAWMGLGEWMAAVRNPLGEGVAGIVGQRRQGLIVNDYRDWRRALPVFLEQSAITASLGEPLLYQGRLLGVITVNDHGTGRCFTERDRETLALFAAQASIAIENARLYQEERNRTRDLSGLIQASRAVTASLDLTQILGSIVTSALELTGAGIANLALREEGRSGPLAWQACADHLQQAFAEATASGPLTVGRALCEQVGARRQSLWAPEIAGDACEKGAEFIARHGLQGYLGVPILAEDRVLGVLSVIGAADGRAGEGRRELLEALAAQAALAIENARLFAQTCEAFDELAAIQEAGQAIAQSLDLPETLQHILTAAMRLTETDKGIIWLLDEERREAVAASSMGVGEDAGIRLSLSEPCLVAACVQEGRVLVSESPADDPRVNRGLQASHENKALIVVPLLSGSRIIGVLDVADMKRPRRFGTRETGILERLAQQAVVAIENARLFGQVLRSKSEWEHTFDSISDLVAVVDLEGRVVRANRALLHRLGLPPGQVLRRACGDVFGDEGPAWGGCPHRRALGLGGRVSLEVEDEKLGGSYSVGVFPVRDADGKAVGTVHIARDITEQKTIQAKLFQSDKLASMGTLAAGVAHNINNVLAAIVARADLLLASATDPEARRSAEVIQQAAMDGAETVRRMQEFAKVKPPAAVGLVDVNRAIAGALELTEARWRDEAQARGAPILVETTLEAASRIEGNAAEVREVLVNLVLNAVDAMPQGGALRIATANRPGRRAGGVVEVRVQDTGVGMSEAVRRRIFDPFFTTKGLSGTGLGLSVSYGLVTKHRGEIAVRSRPGGGTTFLLTFPVAEADGGAPAAPDGVPGAHLGRVLLIEDETALREAVAEALTLDGHLVEAVAGGRDGIRRFRPGTFEVVLTDLGMPEVSGLDVARAVKDADPSVYVILCTGWGNVPGAEDPLRERGVDALPAKPFRVSEVVRAVRAGLEARAAAAGRRFPSAAA